MLLGHEVATYWYSAFKQYSYGKEPDVLHVNVNAGMYLQVKFQSVIVFVSWRKCYTLRLSK